MSDAPKIEAHVVEVDLRAVPAGEGHSDLSYRWVCSCGSSGAWKTRTFQARIGGARHVAAMERGR